MRSLLAKHVLLMRIALTLAVVAGTTRLIAADIGNSKSADVNVRGIKVQAAPPSSGGPGNGTHDCSNKNGNASCPVDLSLAPNTLAVGASRLAPGDTIQRAVDVTNTGQVALNSITFTTDGKPSSSPLYADSGQGLQLSVKRCPVPWTSTSLANGGFIYTCTSATTTIYDGPVATTDQSLGTSPALARNGVDHLSMQLTFPTSAPISIFNGADVSLTYSFTAMQKTG